MPKNKDKQADKYNLPPYRFCDGGEDEETDSKATVPETDTQEKTSTEVKKYKVGDKEHTEEQLSKALKDSENMTKFLDAQGKKGAELNRLIRDNKIKTEDLERVKETMLTKIGSLEAQLEAMRTPEVRPEDIEDEGERAKAEKKQLIKKIDAQNKELQEVKELIKQSAAREKERENAATYQKWHTDILDKEGYTEDSELNTKSNELLSQLMGAYLLPKKYLGWTKEMFADAAKIAKNKVEAFRQEAYQAKIAEDAAADKTAGAGKSPSPEEVQIQPGDDKKTRLEKLAKKYKIGKEESFSAIDGMEEV